MVKLNKGPSVSGPSSSIGIMQFFDADTKGPKMTPEFVFGVAIVLILVIMVARFILIG